MLPWFARNVSSWNAVFPRARLLVKSSKNARTLFMTHTSYLLCSAAPVRRTRQEYAAHREPVRSTTRSVVHGLTSPPFRCQTKKPSLLLAGRQFEKFVRRWPRILPHCRALALHDMRSPLVILSGVEGPAALDSALIRRDLVTRWGLSTFPGSGISSCRRLT